jgi:hypothetical protein
MSFRTDEPAYFANTLQAKELIPSAGCVSNAHVATGAAIAASKLQHRYRYTLAQNGTAASVTVPVGTLQAVASLTSVKAGCIVACQGAATISIDCKKNGVSILTAPLELNSSSSARTLYDATIDDSDGEADDWYELVVTATAGEGTLGTGLLVQVEFDEAAL